VRAARLDTAPLKAGETVNVVGLDGGGELKSRITSIADIDPLQLPLSRSVQFRESNLEVASLVNAPDDFVGVLADDAGRCAPCGKLRLGQRRELVQENRGLSSDLLPRRSISCARQAAAFARGGVHAAVAGERAAAGIERRLGAAHREGQPGGTRGAERGAAGGGSDAARVLQPGDILLAIDDKPVTQFRDVELAVANKEVVNATVCAWPARRRLW